MKKSKIKICGISNLDVLKELINLNINYVGFIFYSKSPRFADSDFLESFKDIDFKNTKPVCVYVNPDEEYVYKTSSYFSNPILQFHGDESNDFCESFGKPLSASFFGNELFESRQGAGGLENARYWQQNFRPSKVAYFVHANHELVPSHLEWSPLGKL